MSGRAHASRVRTGGRFLLGLAVLGLATPAWTEVVIDELTTNQATLTDPPGGASTVVTAGADILGTSRDLVVRRLAGVGPVSAGVAGGVLSFAVTDTTPDTRGEIDLVWDGDNDPLTLDPTGLGGVDLTDGGTAAGIRLSIASATAGAHLVLVVHQDADHASRVGRVLPAIGAPTSLFISFAELVTVPGALGPADLTDVGAIELRIGGTEQGLVLDRIATSSPAIAAAKVDLAAGGGPLPPAGVEPGDTFRYRVTIANSAGAATDVELADLLEPNLQLAPATVRTTPLARRDQYRTVTSTPLDSAASGIASLLANDSDADGNSLAAIAVSGAATTQGGTVDVGADGHFVYTPPAGFQGTDAFSYTLVPTAGDPTLDALGSPIAPQSAFAYVVIDRLPPVVTAGGTLVYTENDPATAIDPALTVTDGDSVLLVGATAQITANYVNGEDVLSFVDQLGITGNWVPATGTLTLSGTSAVANYQTALRAVRYHNTSEDPSTLDRTVAFRASDGVETSAPATATVQVVSVNDRPVLSAGATLAYTENDPATPIDTTITVADADHAQLVSASAQISGNYQNGQDILACGAPCAGLSPTFVPATGTLTLTGNATLAAYQAALRGVTYFNNSDAPSALDRTVTWLASDGIDGSLPVTSTITVTPVNDPPVVTGESFQAISNTRLRVVLVDPGPDGNGPYVYAAGNLLANDTDPDGPAALTASLAAATAGAVVIVAADGSFSYTSPPGRTAPDSFTYDVSDGLATVTGTVTIDFFERVWYVRNNAPAGGLGRSLDPFDTLVEAQTASAANDWIFVFFGDGTSTGQDAGIALKSGQRLVGEHAGLSIPVGLNGNGSPTVLHSGTPGSRPLVDRSGAGNSAVSATDVIPSEIVGLSLSSVAANAIDLTTNPAFAGSGSLSIGENVVRGSGEEGVDVNHGGTGALVLAIHGNTVTAGSRGIDVTRTGGSLTIARFDDNVIHGNTGGSGIEVTGATFDAVPGLPIQQVAGGVTLIGQSGNGVGTHGLLLTNVLGDLGFTDLDIFNDAGTGLGVTSTGALNAGAGTGFRLVVPAGVSTIDSNGGPAVSVNNASMTLPLGFLESTNSTTTGLSLVNAFGGVGATALSVNSGAISDPAGASGDAVVVTGGSGHVTLGIPVSNNNGRAVAISSRTSDTVSFTGAITETGNGILLNSNGAASTTVFAGGLSVSTGANPAFTATSGGRLSICDESPCNPGSTGPLVNALSTTTATVLNLSNTTITPEGVTLRSINSTGASGNTAIILANTGTGPFHVTGTGSSGTGGTIDNKTADGMTMNNTDGPVTLRHMIFEDLGNMGGGIDTISGHDAIHGQDVDGGLTLDGVIIRRISDNAIHGATLASGAATVWNGLTLNNVTFEDSNRFHVAGVGDSNNEGMVRILGIRGPVSVTNSTLQRGGELIDFFVTGGTLTMTATNNNFHHAYKEFTSGPRSSVGGHCIDVTVQGAGNASVTIGDRVDNALDNDFLNCAIGSIRVVGDAGATGNVDVVIGQNEFTVNDHSSGIGGDFDFPQGGVLVGSLGTDTMTWNVVVDGNYFDEIANASGGVGQFTLAMTNGTWNVLVEDNTFDTPGNAPWFLRADSTVSARVMFRNNLGIKGAFCSTDPSSAGGGCNLGAGQLCPGAAGFCGPGLRALADLQNGAVLDLTIINDFFAEHDAGFDPGQTFESRILPTGGGGTLCLDLQNNRAPDGYSLEEFAGDFNLVGSGTCPVGSPSAACATLLGARGNLGGANSPTTSPPFVNVEVGSTIDVVPGACLQPSGPIF